MRVELRIKRGNQSQKEIAALCGVSQQTVSQWELAKSTPGISKMIKIEKIFNEPKETLFPDVFEDI